MPILPLILLGLSPQGPKLVDRPAQHYVAIRTTVTMATIATVAPRLVPEVDRWLTAQGVKPSGPEFIRYLTVDMDRGLELEIGFPVSKPLKGTKRIRPGVLPAGRYASLDHWGDYRGLVGANAAIQEWGKRKGLEWDATPSPKGPRWGGRIEFYFTIPEKEPNHKKWHSQVLYRIKKRK